MERLMGYFKGIPLKYPMKKDLINWHQLAIQSIFPHQSIFSCQLISCRTVFLSLVKPPGWLWPALRHFKSSTLNEEEIYVPQQILIFGVEFGVENVILRFRSWFLERFLDRNWGEQQQVAVRKNGVVLVDKPIRCPVYQYHPMRFPVLHGGGHVSLQVDVSRLAPVL
jgi:hypothetical protein